MTRLELSEWSSVEVELSRDVVGELTRSHGDHIEIRPSSHPNLWTLRATQWVGTIRVDDVSILIRPKVAMPNLLAMMGIDIPSERWSTDLVGLAEEPDLQAAMAKLFCVSCEYATRRGLRRDYQAREERLLAPRGRIDLREVVRRPAVVIPAPCIYDDHTADVRLNRLLGAALGRALRIPEVGPSWRRRLLLLQSELEDVADDADTAWVATWVPNPMERHYESAIRLGALLIEGLTLLDRFGSSSVSSFLLDMNELFEHFVTQTLRGLDDIEIEAQASITLDTDGMVPMRPDIVFRRNGDLVAVADCKYKVLRDGARTGDYYQALAYATACGLSHSWLLYAQEQGAQPVADVQVRNSHTRLQAVGFELSRDLDAVRTEILVIGAEIVSRASDSERALGGLGQ